MRVSSQMMNNMLSQSIQQNQNRVYGKEQQIASGKRIQNASDDPTVWARNARFKEKLGMLEQYSRNSQMLENRLLSYDQTLSGIGDTLKNASELSVTGGDGTMSETDRSVLAKQTNELLEQLVMQANSTFEGKYQFGGVETGSEPFVITRNANGEIDSVTYDGSTFSAMTEIAEGDALPAQLVGADPDEGIFISTSADSFTSLIEMRDRLAAGENLAGTGVQDRVDAALERVLVSRASVGAYQEHIHFVGEIRSNQEMMLNQSIASTEDIDVAEAVTELSEIQTAYQASLAMASKTINMSLLNYI